MISAASTLEVAFEAVTFPLPLPAMLLPLRGGRARKDDDDDAAANDASALDGRA